MEIPEPADGTGLRWWRWHGHVIDLLAEPGHTPKFVQAAILAYRDAVTDEDADLAGDLAWLVAEHPPWSGGCVACRTADLCAVQANYDPTVTSWLVTRSTRMCANPRERSTFDELRRHGR